jgi:MFS transporter, OFA family, oxalate/formate antiporter
MYPYYIASNFKSYEEQDVNAESFITVVGSLGAVTNGLSRGVWSSIQDKIGFRIVYITLLALEIVIAFTFVAIHKVKALYLIWVMISFACLGGHFSIFPTVCSKIYGPTMGGKIYAVIFTSFATATLLNWVLSKLTSKHKIEYDTLFYILASLAVVALIMAIFFKEKSKVIRKESKYLEEKDLTDILNASED